MNLKLNSKRLEHIKSGESVFEALSNLGGKASSSEIVKRIANSVSQPEHVIQPEVKQVLRCAVVNGFLIRHGRNYLLSRSCRTLYTDSGNRRIKSSAHRKKKVDAQASSFSTFGFPIWWQRFWNRFIVSNESKDGAPSEQSTEPNPLNCNESLSSTELNDLVPSLVREAESLSEPTTPTPNTISMADASVPVNKSEENVLQNYPLMSLDEKEANEPKSMSEVPIEEPAGSGESKISVPVHSIESVNDSNICCIDDGSKEVNWMD